MNCTTCENCSLTCGFFPKLPDWKGEGFLCWRPRYWKTEVRASVDVVKVKFPTTFVNPNITDAFAEKVYGQTVLIEKEDRDCFLCSCFKGIDGDFCPVCPKNKNRYYATRCISFGAKEVEKEG